MRFHQERCTGTHDGRQLLDEQHGFFDMIDQTLTVHKIKSAEETGIEVFPAQVQETHAGKVINSIQE